VLQQLHPGSDQGAADAHHADLTNHDGNHKEESMRRRRIGLALLLGSVSGIALAGGWGSVQTITGYYVYDSGSAFIKTSNNENPDACSSSQYLYLDTGAAHFKELWAQVLTAHTSGSTVSLRYEGCSPGGTYPRVPNAAT
jgi:hypothetical protein